MLQWVKKNLRDPYKLLLFSLVLLFIFRPYVHNLFYLAIWKLVLSITLIVSIINQHHKRVVKIAVIVLAIPALFLSWSDILSQHPFLFISNVVITVTLLGICASSIITEIVRRSRVTFETLRGVVSAYFLVAFLFAYLMYLIDYLQPGSIPIRDLTGSFSLTHSLSEMLYYSFVALLMFGTVDVTSSAAQTVIALEGLVGQFYIAILVAKMVSVYTFSPERLAALLKKQLHESE